MALRKGGPKGPSPSQFQQVLASMLQLDKANGKAQAGSSTVNEKRCYTAEPTR